MSDLRTETKAKLENLLERLPVVQAELRDAIAAKDSKWMKAAGAEWRALMEDQAEVIKVACALKIVHTANAAVTVREQALFLKGCYPTDLYPRFAQEIDRQLERLDHALKNEGVQEIERAMADILSTALPLKTQQRLPDAYYGGHVDNSLRLAPAVERLIRERPVEKREDA